MARNKKPAESGQGCGRGSSSRRGSGGTNRGRRGAGGQGLGISGISDQTREAVLAAADAAAMPVGARIDKALSKALAEGLEPGVSIEEIEARLRQVVVEGVRPVRRNGALGECNVQSACEGVTTRKCASCPADMYNQRTSVRLLVR